MELKGYRPAQVARMLGLPRSTVYDIISRGELPAVRFGRVIIVLESDLRSALERGRVSGAGRRSTTAG